MPVNYRFLIVDVFTDRALTGNQLGVFTNATGMSDEDMQCLALELGFSETTFVLRAEADGDFRIRIFSPLRELPFAGHPTLGTAFAMGGPLQKTIVRIETAVGVIPVLLQREGARIIFGSMSQPVPTVAPLEETADLLEALGVSDPVLPVERYDNGLAHVLVALGSDAEVAVLAPDLRALARVVPDATVSCFSVTGLSVKSRVFAPGVGSGEDPATGSAAGPVAVHLARHGLTGWGEEIEISQGSEMGRPSMLIARADGGADGITSVEVGGSAVIVARGKFSF